MALPEKTLTVAGIDPNSHKIAIVESRVTSKKKPFVHTIELGEGAYEKRVSDAFDFVCDYCISVREREGQSPRLFLEAPVMGVGGPGATIPQAFVSGAIMAGAVQGGSAISLVNNSTWKKRVVGNGNVPKTKVSEWVEKNWPVLYKKAPIITTVSGQGKELQNRGDQDILDAGCLNIFGWRYVEMVERINRRRNG